jgi:hypothetical protein
MALCMSRRDWQMSWIAPRSYASCNVGSLDRRSDPRHWPKVSVPSIQWKPVRLPLPKGIPPLPRMPARYVTPTTYLSSVGSAATPCGRRPHHEVPVKKQNGASSLNVVDRSAIQRSEHNDIEVEKTLDRGAIHDFTSLVDNSGTLQAGALPF